jgi:hypothetical protein
VTTLPLREPHIERQALQPCFQSDLVLGVVMARFENSNNAESCKDSVPHPTDPICLGRVHTTAIDFC